MKSAMMLAKERKADKFNRLVLDGHSQTEAWLKVNPRKRSLPETSHASLASRYANDPFVKSRLNAYLRDAKVSDILVPGALAAGLMADIDLSRAKDNMTAVMSGRRLAMQAAEMLKDSVTISQSGITDDELVKRLAGDDPALQKRVRDMLGKPAFDAADATETVVPIKKTA